MSITTWAETLKSYHYSASNEYGKHLILAGYTWAISRKLPGEAIKDQKLVLQVPREKVLLLCKILEEGIAEVQGELMFKYKMLVIKHILGCPGELIYGPKPLAKATECNVKVEIMPKECIEIVEKDMPYEETITLALDENLREKSCRNGRKCNLHRACQRQNSETSAPEHI